MADFQRFLDPKVLAKVSRLDVLAREIVEGYLSGLHKSPYRGSSAEFAEHREYTFGDELRHLDWKVFAKSNRYYIKEYEEETNLRCRILLDTSESMRYAGKGGGRGSERVTKLEYGSVAVACLAYLLMRQQDQVGLALFDSSVYRVLPPRNNTLHMQAMLSQLDTLRGEAKTDMASILRDAAGRIGQRSLVVIVSDLFDDPQTVLKGLGLLRSRRHDVIVFHVLDPDEITFPFDRLTEFIGLEGVGDLRCDPVALKKAYLAEMTAFRNTVRRGCVRQGVDYVEVDTGKPLDVILSAFLAARRAAVIRGARGRR